MGVVVSHDQLSNGEIDSDDIVKQLEKENQDYLEQSRFISQQLSALQTQMHDLRMEEEMGNGTSLEDDDAVKHLPQRDQIHVSLVRQMSLKQTVYDRVRNISNNGRNASMRKRKGWSVMCGYIIHVSLMYMYMYIANTNSLLNCTYAGEMKIMKKTVIMHNLIN